MKLYCNKARPVVLLEVLIAFALVALCALPLIYPHVFILKSERQFVASVELDHLVNLIYADRLQKLYLKEISWAEIEGGKEISLDEGLYKQLGYEGELPFIGTYRFEDVKHKPRTPGEKTIYLFKLIFTFIPKKTDVKNGKDKLRYNYDIVIERRQK